MTTPSARETLEQVFQEFEVIAYPREHECPTRQTDIGCVCLTTPEREITQFKNALLAWHQAHHPQVTREQIMQALEKEHPSEYGWKERTADALLALLTGEPTQTWCTHFTWSKSQNNYQAGYWYRALVSPKLTADWVICPVQGCATPRPAG